MKLRWAVLFLCLAVASAAAQMERNQEKCTIRIDVIFSAGGHAPAGLQVQLLNEMSGVVSVSSTNDAGSAEFSDLAPGEYHAVVSGNEIETADSGTISVNDWTFFLSQRVTIRSKGSNAGAFRQTTSPAISAADLGAPPAAIKEYNRGNQEMARKNWAKAADHFKKAVEIYPRYSTAYNNLAASYEELNQRDQQREALKKAIEFNDHCLPALLNLADLYLQEKNVPEADTLLGKALAIDPNNIQALAYLAKVDVAQGQYDLAIAVARKVHSQPHQGLAVVHFTAASAFEREGRSQDAISELQVFLQESPQGPLADLAHKAIADLQKEVR